MSSWGKHTEKNEQMKAPEKNFAYCPLCDANGLISMLVVRETTRGDSGKLGVTVKGHYLWDLKTEIKLREEIEAGQAVYRASYSCRCERGQAYFEARECNPEMINELEYRKNHGR